MTSARLTRLSLIAPRGAGPLPAPRVASVHEQRPAVKTQLDASLAAHLDTVYRYALRLTHNTEQAQDLTQETMLRAWRKRQTLEDHGATKSWLLRITTNLWTDQLRRKKHQPNLLIEPPASREPPTSKKLIQQESVEQALAALDELPPRQRQVMHLITIEQLSHAEVAEILELTPQATKSNLAAARKTLRTQLQALYHEVCGRPPCPNPNANNSTPT